MIAYWRNQRRLLNSINKLNYVIDYDYKISFVRLTCMDSFFD